MPLIRPFAGLRPVPQYVADVVAPPYDVLNSAEARERVVGKPLSFLHISKAEIDLAEDIDPYDPAVYAKAAENLQQLINDGILMREDQPRYYVYRLTMGDHIQTGLVAAASVKHYDSNRIRKHEFTRPAKENDRVSQIEALNAQTGPVLLAYKSDTEIDALLNQVAEGEPLYQLVADDGIGHAFWVVDDQAITDSLSSAFNAMEAIYIADGHHRSASASRVAKSIGGSDDQMSHYFLSVIFPHKQMKIFDYNRVVTDLNGLSSDDFIKKIKENFSCEKEAAPVKPAQANEFGMYLGGDWYRLKINKNLVPTDPVARLDVSLLADNLLEPILNISDPRTDPRIDFVGGVRGLEGLEKRVDSGEMVVAFSMYATSMDDLIAVADANEVMPPKSTWFEPKLADGLVSHMLD
ncbi:FIG00780345: hypothetical protein [hydrothermal vent metagenome]|uniref:HTH domain of SpoOJ/ParA/ParB/repB family, involved in chromosome partitioning n=1 Tax=hydrothermal vent metagenome TaxID=652676 RepID=A0A3B0XP74_9ZZZZ